MVTIKEIIIVVDKIADEESNPFNNPIIPVCLKPPYAPWNTTWPKFIIGIVAPPPAHLINMSYNPSEDKITPHMTKIVFKSPGVIFVFSNIIWPIAQTNPQKINACKYITISPIN